MGLGRAVLVALVVCLAGCSAVTPPMAEHRQRPPTPPHSPTPSADSVTATETAYPTSPSERLVVGVRASDIRYRRATRLVETAIRYWERFDDTRIVLKPNATEPDVRVEFTDRPLPCGLRVRPHESVCEPTASQAGTTTITISTDFTGSSLIIALEHALGHVLGYDHRAPFTVMNATIPGIRQPPRPDATERANPWQQERLHVFVETTGRGRDVRLDEIDRVLDYYNQGADGSVPGNLTFVRVGNRSLSHITIAFDSGTAECRPAGASCAVRRGINTDSDDAIEYYTSAIIVVADVDPHLIEWHVGHWLAYVLGADEAGDYPPRYRSVPEQKPTGRA